MQFARKRVKLGRSLIWSVLVLCPHGLASAACPPDGWTRESIDALKKDDFRIAKTGTRAALAMALMCFSLSSATVYFMRYPCSGSTAPSFSSRSRTWP